jgi:hypothetical protein
MSLAFQSLENDVTAVFQFWFIPQTVFSLPGKIPYQVNRILSLRFRDIKADVASFEHG